MIYLFIPFSEVEHRQKLIVCANRWKAMFYDPKNIPCEVVSENDVGFNFDAQPIKKIYILAFQGKNETLQPTEHHPKRTISVSMLAERLLKTGLLSATGTINIKLCVSQSFSYEEPIIVGTQITEALRSQGYNNPNLHVCVKYSSEPFPGGNSSKFSYRLIDTSMPTPNIEGPEMNTMSSVESSYTKS